MAEVFESQREELREKYEIDLDFLSCNELPHFVGYDYTVPGRSMLPVDCDYDDPPFHCEINLYQEEEESNICFRYISARILDDEIVRFESHGIPYKKMDYYRAKVMIIYKMMYPEGLRLEDMERNYGR